MLIDLLESSKAIGLCPMGNYMTTWTNIKLEADIFVLTLIKSKFHKFVIQLLDWLNFMTTC